MEALRAGASEDQLHSLLDTAAIRETDRKVLLPEAPVPTVVHEYLPDGLIDLPSAVEKYQLNRKTLHSWVQKGHVRSFGRLKASAPGGGYTVVSEDDLLNYMTAPRNLGGRPKKPRAKP